LYHLIEREILVCFEQEEINSMDEKIMQTISMAAALAQEESCSKSENIKWGIRQSFR